ncbi:MAG: carboxyl transferase domain-containing protein [Myxococcota bacterium]|nr:carboxyl transferase domain-containing protein [Myxococcota bacterium]
MSVLSSGVNPKSESFKENSSAYAELTRTLRAHQRRVVDGDRDRSIERHRSRGKYLPRERIDMCVDAGTPFLEFSTLAGHGQYDDEVPGAGMVTGIGIVCGTPCVFIANDATVKGGTLLPASIQKHVRAQDIALENRLPTIYLVDSGGAFLPMQDEVFPAQDHFGGTFYRQVRMSNAGLPQLSVVLGGCTAGGAYVPALSDEVIIVKGSGRIFLGGPPIVKAALGEIVDPEDLGGADLHTLESGVADHIAYDEPEAYAKVRELVGHMNQPGFAEPPRASLDPLFAASEMSGVVSADARIPFDVRDLIARLVDGSEFHEFKPRYGDSIITGTAHLHGYPVGVLGNNGIIFSDSALKATHFIEMCNQRNIPLLFLQNTSGYMVGRDSEAGGIAKNGAKMVAAVASSTVPKFTVHVGGSYGAGNYGMCGRGLRPRFLFAWPNSRIATMSAETAQTVLVDVRKGGMDKAGVTEAELEAIRQQIGEQYERQSDPYYATSRLWDDGLIEPSQTRDVLGMCLALAARVPTESGSFRVFRM